MTEDKEPGTGGKSSVFLDIMTSKIGKVGALIGAIAVVLSQAVEVGTNFQAIQKSIFREKPKTGSEVTAHSDCIKGADLLVQPDEVLYNKWRSDLTLKLTGAYTCKSNILAYVSFTAPKGRLIIEPPFWSSDDSSACGRSLLQNPGCWGEITLDDSRKEWKIMHPNLRSLVDQLEFSETIPLKWDLMESASGTRLSTGTAQVTVKGDPKTPAPGS